MPCLRPRSYKGACTPIRARQSLTAAPPYVFCDPSWGHPQDRNAESVPLPWLRGASPFCLVFNTRGILDSPWGTH